MTQSQRVVKSILLFDKWDFTVHESLWKDDVRTFFFRRRQDGKPFFNPKSKVVFPLKSQPAAWSLNKEGFASSEPDSSFGTLRH
jgi:hypothetical protein